MASRGWKGLCSISQTERMRGERESIEEEREVVRSRSERGQGGEGAQLTGASSGSGACFPKEVQEA